MVLEFSVDGKDNNYPQATLKQKQSETAVKKRLGVSTSSFGVFLNLHKFIIHVRTDVKSTVKSYE